MLSLAYQPFHLLLIYFRITFRESWIWQTSQDYACLFLYFRHNMYTSAVTYTEGRHRLIYTDLHLKVLATSAIHTVLTNIAC